MSIYIWKNCIQHRAKLLQNKQQHIFNRKENTKETSYKKISRGKRRHSTFLTMLTLSRQAGTRTLPNLSKIDTDWFLQAWGYSKRDWKGFRKQYREPVQIKNANNLCLGLYVGKNPSKHSAGFRVPRDKTVLMSEGNAERLEVSERWWHMILKGRGKVCLRWQQQKNLFPSAFMPFKSWFKMVQGS